MFKVFGIIGISKFKFFNFPGIERVKKSGWLDWQEKQVKGALKSLSNLYGNINDTAFSLELVWNKLHYIKGNGCIVVSVWNNFNVLTKIYLLSLKMTNIMKHYQILNFRIMWRQISIITNNSSRSTLEVRIWRQIL